MANKAEIGHQEKILQLSPELELEEREREEKDSWTGKQLDLAADDVSAARRWSSFEQIIKSLH